MLNGWVSLDRAILKHWVSQEPELLACWVHLLLEANFEDRKRMFNGSLVEIKRGQCVFGLNAFSAKTGISQKKLRRYIDMLESEGMVGRQKTNKYSLISITNYDYYQTQGRQEAGKGQAEGKPGAIKGQHLNKDNKGNQGNNKKLSTELATPDAVFYIPTNKYGTEGETFPVTQEMIDKWRQIYPAVNIEAEIRKNIGWADANPSKRKTMGGMPRHLNTWLSGAQDRGGGRQAGGQSSQNDILGGTTW